MTIEAAIRIKKEVARWARDTRALLLACEQLIAYFGTAGEAASWRAAIALPAGYIEAVFDALTTRIELGASISHPRGRTSVFACSEKTARLIVPLLRVAAEPAPPFVRTIRTLVPAQERKALLIPFGIFFGQLSAYVCEPVWTAYPQLALKEWSRLDRGAVLHRSSRALRKTRSTRR